MFRKLPKLMRAYRERVLALVMLPAFFFGTLPHTACICADGHREASCPMLARHPSSQTSSACGGPACCQRTTDPSRSCCRAKGGPPASAGCGSQCATVGKTGSCCHPVIEQAPPAVTAQKSQVASQPVWMATVEMPLSLIPAAALWPAVYSPVQSPPPLDAVIAFSRLTI